MSDEATTSPDQGRSTAYDRDAIVSSITRYYELLSKMVAVRPKDIAYPPEGGWDDDTIPLAKLRRLGLNDRAIDLVRHLPYVFGERPIYLGTEPIIYHQHLFEYPEEDYKLDEPHDVEMWPLPEQRIPEGVVPLSRMFHGDPSYTWWILETDTGEFSRER